VNAYNYPNDPVNFADIDGNFVIAIPAALAALTAVLEVLLIAAAAVVVVAAIVWVVPKIVTFVSAVWGSAVQFGQAAAVATERQLGIWLAEHTKGARRSTDNKHQKAETRRNQYKTDKKRAVEKKGKGNGRRTPKRSAAATGGEQVTTSQLWLKTRGRRKG